MIPFDSMLRRILAILTLALLASACASTTPPLATSQIGVVIDPRVGYIGESSPSLDKKFASDWDRLKAGDIDGAARGFASLQAKNPQYAPATLGRAVASLAKGDVDVAQTLVDAIAQSGTTYYAADAYRAEIARKKGDLAAAYATYKLISANSDSPESVRTRYGEIRKERYEELVGLASHATSAAEAIGLLQQALEAEPAANATRADLARRLVETGSYADARTEVTKLVDGGLVDTPDVQSLLASIESGEGKFQDALVRLERLAKRYPDAGYEARIEEVKLAYMRANLPPRYMCALEAKAITRADLAVLSYWEVSAVRFAPVVDPPIAVDIADVPGRDEMVHALDLRLLSVDPLMRTVDPQRAVTGSAMLRVAGQLLRLGGSVPCAESAGANVQQALLNCSVPIAPLITSPDGTVSGKAAVEIFSAIEAAHKSAEK